VPDQGAAGAGNDLSADCVVAGEHQARLRELDVGCRRIDEHLALTAHQFSIELAGAGKRRDQGTIT
jgi:hypothetical protein